MNLAAGTSNGSTSERGYLRKVARPMHLGLGLGDLAVAVFIQLFEEGGNLLLQRRVTVEVCHLPAHIPALAPSVGALRAANTKS